MGPKNCFHPGGRSCIWPPAPGESFWLLAVTATLTTAGVTRDATASIAWSSDVSAEMLSSSIGDAARTPPCPANSAAPNMNAPANAAGTATLLALATNSLVDTNIGHPSRLVLLLDLNDQPAVRKLYGCIRRSSLALNRKHNLWRRFTA